MGRGEATLRLEHTHLQVRNPRCIVTVDPGYSGALPNEVQVTTVEGAVGKASLTVCANNCIINLPLVLKDYEPPWITVTASGNRAWGKVGPSSLGRISSSQKARNAGKNSNKGAFSL